MPKKRIEIRKSVDFAEEERRSNLSNVKLNIAKALAETIKTHLQICTTINCLAEAMPKDLGNAQKITDKARTANNDRKQKLAANIFEAWHKANNVRIFLDLDGRKPLVRVRFARIFEQSHFCEISLILGEKFYFTTKTLTPDLRVVNSRY